MFVLFLATIFSFVYRLLGSHFKEVSKLNGNPMLKATSILKHFMVFYTNLIIIIALFIYYLVRKSYDISCGQGTY